MRRDAPRRRAPIFVSATSISVQHVAHTRRPAETLSYLKSRSCAFNFRSSTISSCACLAVVAVHTCTHKNPLTHANTHAHAHSGTIGDECHVRKSEIWGENQIENQLICGRGGEGALPPSCPRTTRAQPNFGRFCVVSVNLTCGHRKATMIEKKKSECFPVHEPSAHHTHSLIVEFPLERSLSAAYHIIHMRPKIRHRFKIGHR